MSMRLFRRVCNYFRWYCCRKEAIREVLAEERRKTERARKRLKEQHQEREMLNGMLRSRVGGTEKTG